MGPSQVPSTISGKCYVDLINEANEIETTIKLPVKHGTAVGNIAIGDFLTEGVYRLRAYTQWMRNAGDKYVFDKPFIIGDGSAVKISDVSSTDLKSFSSTRPDANDDTLEIKVTTNKLVFKPREPVQMKISALMKNATPVIGNFSISVVNENMVPLLNEPEYSIFSSILNGSGRDTSAMHLSTHNSKFNAEKPGIDVAGKVTHLNGSAVSDGKVMLLSLNGGIMEEVRTNRAGEFTFKDLRIVGDITFMIQAKTASSDKHVILEVDKPSSVPYPPTKRTFVILPNDPPGIPLNQASSITKDERRTSVSVNRARQLKQVNIRGKNQKSLQFAAQGGIVVPEGHSDQTYTMESPEFCPSLGICLQNKLHGVIFRNVTIDKVLYPYYPGTRGPKNAKVLSDQLMTGVTPDNYTFVKMNVILDGRKLDEHEVGDLFSHNSIDPTDIIKIEVVRSSLALSSMLGGPTILIYTKSTKDKFGKSSPNVAYFTISGLSRSKQFNAPQYSDYTKSKTSDLRTTIYWNPVLKTDVAGQAVVNFFTTDIEGIYKVTIEGFSNDGKLGRQIYRFKVNKKS
jgi:hypothetical protein